MNQALSKDVNKKISPAIDRLLVGSERNYWVANQFSVNNVISVVKGSGPIYRVALTEALKTLQVVHPMLRVHIQADKNTENPRFVENGTQAIQLNHKMLNTPAISEQLLELSVRQQLNTSVIDSHYPLARVEFIKAQGQWILIVCCSHIISDASSVMTLARDIITYLGRSYGDQNQHLLVRMPTHPVRPPLEDCFPKKYRGLRTLGMVLLSQMRIAIQQSRKKPSRLIPEQMVPYEQRRNGLLRQTIAFDVFEQLKLACKSRNVSVHGILTAVLSLSVAKELKNIGQLKSQTLGIGSPVNFRSELEIDVEQELGTYICTLFSFVNITLDEWDLAKAINNEIRYRFINKEHYASLNLLKWLAPKSKRNGKNLVDYIERKGPGNICVSNIGLNYFDAVYGQLHVESAEWFASLSITGYLLMSVNTSLDTCHLNYTYIEKVVSEKTAKAIADRVETMLRKLVAEDAK